MCEGIAMEQSSKFLHESSKIKNRQVRFQVILCPNPKWPSCFYDKQLSVPIDGSANFKFLALHVPSNATSTATGSQQCNNHSCLCKDCNNNCNKDSSPRNKKCNNERTKITAQQVQSNSNSE